MCGRWNVVRLAFFSERASFWKRPAEGEGKEGEITAAGAHSLYSRRSAPGLYLSLDLRPWNNPVPLLLTSAIDVLSIRNRPPVAVIRLKSPPAAMECAAFDFGLIKADGPLRSGGEPPRRRLIAAIAGHRSAA